MIDFLQQLMSAQKKPRKKLNLGGLAGMIASNGAPSEADMASFTRSGQPTTSNYYPNAQPASPELEELMLDSIEDVDPLEDAMMTKQEAEETRKLRKRLGASDPGGNIVL